MTSRPRRYPQVAATPGGNFAEPPSGVQLGGWPVGAVFPSSDANWLLRQLTDWNRAHDAHRLASIDILAATVSRVSATPLTLATGAGVGLIAHVMSGGVYYGAGERLDLSEAPTVYSGGNALVFPPAAASYVLARAQPSVGGAANGSSCAELRVSSGPIAGWVTLLFVTTNATDIVAAVETMVTPYLEWGITPDFAAGLRGTTGEFTGSLSSLDLTTGEIVGSHALLGGEDGQPTLIVQSDLLDNPAILAYGLNNAKAIHAYSNGGGGTIIHADAASFGASGVGLIVDGNSSSTAARIVAGAGQAALASTASGTSAYNAVFNGGVSFTIVATAAGDGGGGIFSGSGTGSGIEASGGTGAGAVGVFAAALSSTGYALYARTAAAAANTVAGAKLEGRGSAAGAEVHAENYYAAILYPKTSTPSYAALFTPPQGAYPTNRPAGALGYASYAFGSRPHWIVADADDPAWRGLWSSRGGFVYGGSYGQTASNADATTYTTLCTVTLTNGNAPKEAGRSVRCEVKIRVRTSTAAANGIDVRIRDTTAGANVVEYVGSGTGNFAGWPLPGATTGWDRDVTFDFDYAIPVEGDRTFLLQFKRQSATNTVTAHGSLVITGAY